MVFDYKVNERIEAAGDVILSIKSSTIGNPEIVIRASESNETISKLSDGTVFAYEYCRFCWKKTDDRIMLHSLEVDTVGSDMGPVCPGGSKENLRDL
jgi:hypothetical protein